MKLIVVTSTRLLGDGLAACMLGQGEIILQETVSDLSRLRRVLDTVEADIVLIDVTQGVDLDDVREIAFEHPGIALVALGLQEQRQEIIRCGRAGFSGYVGREATVDELCRSLSDVINGRLVCSSDISGGLLRALFLRDSKAQPANTEEALTRREGEVLKLVGCGLSNKEIARELSLSPSTVKHHVHNVLGKLKLPRRAQAMRRVREAPWIASSPSSGQKYRV